MARQVMMAMGPGADDVDRMKEEVNTAADEGSLDEDQGFMSLIQELQVSPKVLKGLIGALNKVLPLFGVPALKGEELSPELARGLSMVAGAVLDASSADEAPVELVFSMDDVKGGDGAVLVIAGKLDRLSKTSSFKKFLKSKPSSPADQPPAGDPVAAEKVAEQGPDIESLFASRMG